LHAEEEPMPTPVEFVSAHRAQLEAELCDLLRIPSISTLPAHREDTRAAARWIADHLRSIGLDTELIESQGHPLVYAEWTGARGQPTVLGYGHYDVQPADPLPLWTTPPFEPTVRGRSLYARGAVDDKGLMFTMIAAVRAYLATGRPLPVNVKFIIEGEEECGGAAIETYVREHGDRLRADAALILDSGMFAPGLPAITLGLRGIVMTEVTVTGAARDLHSGLYGGVAPNPFIALAAIIAGLKDPDGRILVPGFYDRVVPPDPEERAAWDRLPFDEDALLRNEIGAAALVGEPGFGALERMWARPTLDVHGMPGGFTGEGSKTVIPARASAKISMRLVANQDPQEIARAFDAHVRWLAPSGVRCDVRLYHGASPVVISPAQPAIRAAREALTDAFGRETVFVRTGGTVPIVADFAGRLGLPCVVTGWALPDASVHSPDERLDLDHFHMGIVAVMRFLERMARA
jgi:acetylornithine deacetylase/succinyl-diaminopimelate desuccinylase-like protein